MISPSGESVGHLTHIKLIRLFSQGANTHVRCNGAVNDSQNGNRRRFSCGRQCQIPIVSNNCSLTI